MKGVSAIVTASVLLLAGTANVMAQAPPKPGPEHQKLSYFVGKWTSETDLKANPFMPAGKYTSTETCEIFQGGFALTCRGQGTSPMGPTHSMSIIGYNNEEKVYTFYGVDNNGMVPATVAKGRNEGDTWTFEDESKFGGQLVKSRYSMKTSPTSYNFKWEVHGPNGWATMMEGVSKKAD